MLFVRYALWIVPNVLVGLVLIKFLRSRLQMRFPFFLAYLIYQLIEFILLFTVNILPWFSASQYQWFFVAGQGIATVLKFAILYEVTNDLLAHHSSLGVPLRRLLRWIAALTLLAGSAGSALLLRPSFAQVENAFSALNLLSNTVLSGLLVCMFVFRKFFSIPWAGFSAGIALGFGIFASVELAASALRIRNIFVDSVTMVAYLICVAVWLTYLFRRDSVGSGQPMNLQKTDMDSWSHQLEKMVNR